MRAEVKKETSLIELLDLCRKNAELEASGVTKIARTAPGWMKRLSMARRYPK
ncbi:MAG TPA: hypothetical protein VMW61_00165 [Dehalococcoidales bacterium]|nr:hypothetical protein [Dehalococcoidales bacterium]